jgi:hypothetical protein
LGSKVSTEAKESSVLEAVTRKRLVKTQKIEKKLVIVVICEVWISAMAL